VSDPRRDDDAPWQALREIEPPPGARARVRRKIEASLDARATPRRRVRGVVLLFGAAVSVVVVMWLLVSESSTRPLRARLPSPPVAPQPAPATTPRQVAVAAGQRVELPLPRGHVSLRGPVDATVGADARVVLRSGTVDALGRVDVLGPSCEAHVDGSAEVAVARSELVVHVFSGSATVVPADASCRVVELMAPTPSPVVAPAPVPVRRVRTAPPAPPSPLAAEVAAYRHAITLERVDPIAALGSWRAAQRDWPHGALAHEVDLHVIETLVRLGHADEARVEARAFLARHPDSPRSADVRRIAETPRP
jgi:hypothetical protein